jgi:hypothetical protein
MNGQEKRRLGLPSGITLGIVKRDDVIIIYIKKQKTKERMLQEKIENKL